MGIGRKIFGSFYDTWKGFRKQREFERNFYDNRIDAIDEEFMDIDKIAEKYGLFDIVNPVDNLMSGYKLKPMNLKMNNKKEVQALMDQWVKKRKAKRLETEDLQDGIKLFIEYELFFDEMEKLLRDFLQSEAISLLPDSNRILMELMYCSHRTFNLEAAMAMYESYVEEDLNAFYEKNIKLVLDIVGLNTLKFKSEAVRNDKEFIYHVSFNLGSDTISYKCWSDNDIFEPIYFFLNQILIKVGSTQRFYNLGGYKSLLDKRMLPTLMKRHEILVFI